MGDIIDVQCQQCGYTGAIDNGDGYFYCDRCGCQVEDMVETALDDQDHGLYTGNALRRRPSAPMKAEPLSQCEPKSQFWESLKTLDNDYNYGSNRVKVEEWADGTGPIEPGDFGQTKCPDKEEDLKMTYLIGLQAMIELQTKALVEKFNASPLICGIAGTIWLRYLASTDIEDDQWADEVIKESESQKEGLREDFKPRFRQKDEKFNIHGQRAVMLWYRSLSKIIPLSHTLVITYLSCHLAREAVLPTDLFKWSLEGKLPFFTAFIEIEKEFRALQVICPISCSFMFKPSETISLFKLESQAASVARKIGLELPPVNFYAIASRYLKQLSLDTGKILRSVSQIHEWCMPPDLYLSSNEMRLPTRVCVLSMVILAIRVLFDIHGYGYWEKSFSDLFNGKILDGTCISSEDSSEKSRDVKKTELEAMQLLRHLEERYDELKETYERSKDLPNYLQYCKDVVFGGMESSYEDLEEEKLIEQLWDYFQNKKDSLRSNNHDYTCTSPSKRSKDEVINSAKKSKKRRDISSRINDSSQESMSVDYDSSQQSMSIDGCQTSDIVSEKDKAMQRLKSNMKDKSFCYISPRVKVKRRDYLQYVRKKDGGAYTYAAHADYYILLRSCARVAKVDVRVMHCGVMILERRLGWLEKRIDYCSSRLGPEEEFCEHCHKERNFYVRDGSVDVSKLNI